jgi:hypothetical protein
VSPSGRRHRHGTHPPRLSDHLGAEVILDDLVFHIADAGFSDRQFGKSSGIGHPGRGHRLADPVNLLLGESLESFCCLRALTTICMNYSYSTQY